MFVYVILLRLHETTGFEKIGSFQKRHPNQKGRCPDTLDTHPGSAPDVAQASILGWTSGLGDRDRGDIIHQTKGYAIDHCCQIGPQQQPQISFASVMVGHGYNKKRIISKADYTSKKIFAAL